jgi:glyoxylase-like metal-dependent hydrolase (beta-lactamase superfamily II)
MSVADESPDTFPVERLRTLGITVFERGWLSSNNILLTGGPEAALVDTGYATHADLSVELVRQALGARPLARILNTHLHSDHCGGNAALKAAWPQSRIAIPPGLAHAVRKWDAIELSHAPTGQQCPRFAADELLTPGSPIELGGLTWEVLAAQGHDPHAVILYQPEHRILISADAPWANGFGVVFPELEGESGFDEVRATLDLIAGLDADIVIPGHGAVFGGQAVQTALRLARSRLAQFEADPARHRRHALKVLVKFKLLEWQRCHQDALSEWFLASDYFCRIAKTDSAAPMRQVLDDLLSDLQRSGALRREGDLVVNA